MYKTCVTAVAALTVFAFDAQARADGRPVEIGGGGGAALTCCTERLSGGDVRVSVPAGERGHVETLVAVTAPAGEDRFGLFGVQYKRTVGSRGSSGARMFVTAGAFGVYYRDRHDTAVLPPVLALVGGGVEQPLARRLAVRVEAQAMLFAVYPAGVRVAAGVSVPLGRLDAARATGSR